ncbi:DUF805 domain-containing protein [Chitinimonas naiadis]
MSQTVQLLLDGTVLPGHDAGQAAPALAALLKITEPQAQAMLAGTETIIKKQLPEEQVARYLSLFEQIGVRALTRALPPAIEPAPAPQRAETPPPTVVVPPPPVAAVTAKPPPQETITCPSCSFVQPKRTLCRECGADMPRVLAAQRLPKEEYGRDPSTTLRGGRVLAQLDDDGDEEAPAFLSLHFEGRLNRLRYMAYSALVYLPVLLLVLAAVIVLGVSGSGTLTFLVAGIGGLACFCLSLRVMALRLHDVGLSGKWLWLFPASGLIVITGSPIAGMVLAGFLSLATLALCLVPGTAGDNEYGSRNGPNTGWIQLGAVAFVVMGVLAAFAGDGRKNRELATTTTVTEAAAGKPGQLSGGIVIDESDDPAEQEALVRQAVDKAARERGIILSPEDREIAVQRYLRAMRGESLD